MTAGNNWFRPRGSLQRDGWEVVVDGAIPGMQYAGLRVASAGRTLDCPPGPVERLVIPLEGDVRIDHEGDELRLAGRPSVFAGPTDVAFFGTGSGFRLSTSGRVAVAEAPATATRPMQVIRADDAPPELRGAGAASREVRNLGMLGVLDAERLIVCEVLTPAGNWSSYPAHKHDEQVAARETRLEEIYYFDARPVTSAFPDADPFGFFAVYSSAAGEIDLTTLVRPGDVALVPFGYHGPAAAPPDYDLYYLNVMAGPDPGRSWLVQDDPRQGWVRDQWSDQRIDPRLPFGTSEGASS